MRAPKGRVVRGGVAREGVQPCASNRGQGRVVDEGEGGSLITLEQDCGGCIVCREVKRVGLCRGGMVIWMHV